MAETEKRWFITDAPARCLPKATSTPSAGSAPGANNAKKKKNRATTRQCKEEKDDLQHTCAA